MFSGSLPFSLAEVLEGTCVNKVEIVVNKANDRCLSIEVNEPKLLLS